MAEKNYKEVFTIRENDNGKGFWTKVGVAFVNRDGSLNVRLDALPLDGKLQIRDPKEKREHGAQA